MAWGIIFGEEKNGGGFWPFWAGKRVISDLKHLPTLDTILISSGFLRANPSPLSAIWAGKFLFLFFLKVFVVFNFFFKVFCSF